jgi:hypothetical protein
MQVEDGSAIKALVASAWLRRVTRDRRKLSAAAAASTGRTPRSVSVGLMAAKAASSAASVWARAVGTVAEYDDAAFAFPLTKRNVRASSVVVEIS